MAKKQSQPKSQGFTIQGFDAEHYKQTDAYVKAIDDLYSAAVRDFANMCGSLSLDPSKPFAFSDYPTMQKKAQAIVNNLAAQMTAVIQHGTRDQWLYACKKNDAFLAHIMQTSKIGKRQLNRFQDRNMDALTAFQDRKVSGLDLSQRVWKYAGQIKGQMELGIDIAVGDGRSAADLSRDLRTYLQEPDKLFRRVRDKHGNLHLSKAAAAYHPGQGVYRSSYLNALRLARTEINMAYRDSDRYRWANMDFVVGYEVHLSNNHTTKGPDGKPKPFHDICDELAGRYPKDFVFKGWHPQCRCFVTPILMDPDEFNTDELNELTAAINGTEYKKFSSRQEITDVPPNFKKYVQEHKKTFAGWSKPPYWIRDNYKGGEIDNGLRLRKPTIPKPADVNRTKYDDLPYEERQKYFQEWDSMFESDEYLEMEDAAKWYGLDISYLKKLLEQDLPDKYWLIPDAKAEFKRVQGELDRLAISLRADAQKALETAGKYVQDVKTWIDATTSDDWIGEQWRLIGDDRWPDYPSTIRYAEKKATEWPAMIKQKQKEYFDLILEGNRVVKEGKGNAVNTANLESLLSVDPSPTRNAIRLSNEIRKEIDAIKLEIDKKLVGVLSPVIEDVKKSGVDYRGVSELSETLTDEKIIERLGGGDMTKGSCSSLAFAYAANRGGLDVLDFRGGKSQDFFSTCKYIRDIVKNVGGMVEYHVSGVEMMKKTEIGKEYYLAIGRHAAVVRQVSKGKYQYLELQSWRQNGWKDLNARIFSQRFSANGREWSAEMCEVSLLFNDKSFKKLMGYINTKESEQKKGASGSIK